MKAPEPAAKGIGRFRPAIAAALAATVFAVLAAFGPMDGVAGLVLAATLAIPCALLVVAGPKLLRARNGRQIDDALPFFITHFGVLATTNLPRTDLLRLLAENPEYAAIGGEMRRVLRLSTEWGMSLADAVRAVAATTPSKLFGAFLLRLAHATESGQPLESFLMSEQSVVMQEYGSLYEANLLKVDAWKEMYTNSIMTIGFMAVFAAVLPLLGQGDLLVLTLGVAVIALFLESMLGVALQDRLPRDRLSPQRPLRNAAERQLRLALFGGGAASVALLLVVASFAGFGWGLLAACLPAVVPGVLAVRHEASIRQREADYPAFIRSVGASAAARGTSVREVLGAVQANKLGALTEPVRSLHRRLAWGVDDTKAWQRFGEETGSRLIDSFTTMFVEGVASGGKPHVISDIVSKNMMRILALRGSRRATAGAFRGLLYGLSGGLALILFLGTGIFENLMGTFGEHAQVLSEQGLLRIQQGADMGLAQQVLFVVVFAHGVASGLYYKLVEGGRMEAAALYSSSKAATGLVVALTVVWLVPRLL